MKLYHYFGQRTAKSPLKSTYEIGDGEPCGENLLRPTGSAVKALRALRKAGYDVPAEMNGPQVRQYTVELSQPEATAKVKGGAK